MDDQEFTKHIEDFGPAMFRAARAVSRSDADAEDAVGQAVLTAYERRGSLRDPGAARAWLVRIAVNAALQDRRRRERVDYLEDLPREPAAPERPESLADAVAALPSGQRAVVTLYYYEGFSTREIAKLLGGRRGTVMSRLARAREELRKMLEEG